MKDPGSFTIPCIIGGVEFQKALCDSGASINLMPLSVAKQLSLGEFIPTTITLQMADRSMVKPEGVLEDVLVIVGKFFFPVDFIILDMEEDSQVPLLLGRTRRIPTRINLMNPRGPPGTPTDIETFPQNNQLKSMERTPLQSLTYI